MKKNKNRGKRFLPKKYELLNETGRVQGVTVHRIRAIRRFGIVAKGTLGGFVESEHNLSHAGNCWVSCDAAVIGRARVLDDAFVGNFAVVSGAARVGGQASLLDRARVSGKARISGMAKIVRNADIRDQACISGSTLVGDRVRILGSCRLRGGVIIVPGAEKHLRKAAPR
jgi:hypothetical protein